MAEVYAGTHLLAHGAVNAVQVEVLRGKKLCLYAGYYVGHGLF